ncbi:hypothetical protein CAEBREN_10790 [Caenorhabditis brenneri]|uniref:Uncharacterized protein n=1 Tax=Caenorhabditis brenneri TaxID=135651 RepID=G0NL81_CAEBE|nr:hypothetical protein CAEBREN_10790 [Caenorhabditis brenneri]
MSLPPKLPNQFSPDKPITQGYRPWTPVSNSSLMFPSANNANMIRPGPIYFTPLTTKKLQNSNEGRMNIPTPIDASSTQVALPGSSPSAYNMIKKPASQSFSAHTIRHSHYAQDVSSTSYPPLPLHYSSSANCFSSELSRPPKATVFQQNDSLNDYGTKERPQSPDVNGPPIDDLLGIKDLYPSGSINIADYLPVIFS